MKIKNRAGDFLGGDRDSARADNTVRTSAARPSKLRVFITAKSQVKRMPTTTAAIRRFQIRNGLQVTGELNSDTNRALVSSNPTPAPTAAPRGPPLMSPLSLSPDDEKLAEPSQGAPAGSIRRKDAFAGGDKIYQPNPAYSVEPGHRAASGRFICRHTV